MARKEILVYYKTGANGSTGGTQGVRTACQTRGMRTADTVIADVRSQKGPSSNGED